MMMIPVIISMMMIMVAKMMHDDKDGDHQYDGDDIGDVDDDGGDNDA